MQEQARMMEAQRQALQQQGVSEENYTKGFEDGLKKGFESGKDATFKDFQANYPAIETNAIRNMANAVFTMEIPDNFRNLIDQTEAALKIDPNDNLRKALLVLYRFRLAELQPPPPPTKKKSRAKN